MKPRQDKKIRRSNLREKVKQLDFSFDQIHIPSRPKNKREIILPSLLTKEKLDQDIEMLSKLL